MMSQYVYHMMMQEAEAIALKREKENSHDTSFIS